MEQSTKQRLIDAGINVESGIARFMGHEELYLKFLKKFSQDTNFQELQEAVNQKDTEKCFRCAHTLKGVCGNLSLDRLYDLVSQQTEYFRGENYEDGAELMETVSKTYAMVREAIEKIM